MRKENTCSENAACRSSKGYSGQQNKMTITETMVGNRLLETMSYALVTLNYL